jgi:L-fuconolactonase
MSANVHYIPNRLDWLARVKEPVLEPGLPIVDPHHHLWDRPGWPYMMPDLLADTNTGHNIVSTVFVQCRAFHKASGPEELRPVGETQFVAGVAAMSESGQYGKTRICEGIVGHANMMLGAKVEPVLEAHVKAGNGRFRGIRHITAWDPNPVIMNPAYTPPRHALQDKTFQEGLRVLGRMGLTFDAWLYHPQISELTALARAVPEATIVLDHLGGPLGIGGYAGRRDEVMTGWRPDITELASCPNVVVKVGGIGMAIYGLGFEERPTAPSSDDLVAAWGGPITETIELFGADRCMFESNFPVDKVSCSYVVLWNAFKKIAAGASPQEKASLFHGTATRAYSLD